MHDIKNFAFRIQLEAAALREQVRRKGFEPAQPSTSSQASASGAPGLTSEGSGRDHPLLGSPSTYESYESLAPQPLYL